MSSGRSTSALAIIYAGFVLIGIGHTVPFTLGITLVEDKIERKKDTPLYYGRGSSEDTEILKSNSECIFLNF